MHVRGKLFVPLHQSTVTSPCRRALWVFSSLVPLPHDSGGQATDDGTLIVANGSTGELYKVDPETGVSTVIDLGGEVLGGDGLVRPTCAPR